MLQQFSVGWWGFLWNKHTQTGTYNAQMSTIAFIATAGTTVLSLCQRYGLYSIVFMRNGPHPPSMFNIQIMRKVTRTSMVKHIRVDLEVRKLVSQIVLVNAHLYRAFLEVG